MELEDLDVEIPLLLVCFFARVELAAAVDEFSASEAFHGEGGHEAYGLETGTGLFGTAALAGEFARVEVGRVIFLEDFTFGHGECLFV